MSYQSASGSTKDGGNRALWSHVLIQGLCVSLVLLVSRGSRAFGGTLWG